MDQVDPSTDPTTNEQITAAFGLNIEYHPDQEQNGYWEVGSLGTAPTHTLEEAEQRVQNIADTLEENNIEYELGRSTRPRVYPLDPKADIKTEQLNQQSSIRFDKS
jgi:hypothetical protein